MEETMMKASSKCLELTALMVAFTNYIELNSEVIIMTFRIKIRLFVNCTPKY